MSDHLQEGFHLDALQLEAIEMCTDFSNRVVAVTGLAGSGKTTIIRETYMQTLHNRKRVVLAAPTGKAARRIKEATGINAVTIHKLLEYNRPGERDEKTGKALDVTQPKRGRMNPLEYDVVIVDEYAMVPHQLHNNLVAALPSGGCLRVFGDVNQLPPIEEYRITDKNGRTEPSPFAKLLERKGSCVRLENVYRQGKGSNVLLNANKVRKGHTPVINQDLEDFFITIQDRPVDWLKKFVKAKLESGVNFADLKNQIIVPSRKSWVGTSKLNIVLRTVLNPSPSQAIQLPRHKWDADNPVTIGLHDKVVCTQNNYDLRPYTERYEQWTDDMRPIGHSFIPVPDNAQMLNGETGVVVQIYPDGAVDVDFGDRIVNIPERYEEYWAKGDRLIDVYPLRDIDLAYALTTHKCQGSEFEEVCYIMNKSMQFSQSRQNFYTAMTRASLVATICTDQLSLRQSLFKVAS